MRCESVSGQETRSGGLDARLCEPGPGVVVVEGARLVAFRVLAHGPRAVRQVARAALAVTGRRGPRWVFFR